MRTTSILGFIFLFLSLIACQTQTINTGFDLILSGSTLLVQKNSSNHLSISITRNNGFTGDVNVTLSGQPSGIKAEPLTISGNATNGDLIIRADSTTTVGLFNLSIDAKNRDVTVSKSLVLTININSTVTLTTFVDQVQANVAWAAYQDGLGAWQLLTGTAGIYTFNVSDATGRYGVVTACPQRVGVLVQVFHGTIAETSSVTQEHCVVAPKTPQFFTVSGTVSDLASEPGSGRPQVATVKLGTYSGDASSSSDTPNYSFQAPTGTYDLIATRAFVNLSEGGLLNPNKMIILRDKVVTGNQIINLDFASQGFVPTAHLLSSSNPGYLGAGFLTAEGAVLANSTSTPGSTSLSFTGVPLSEQVSGDVHLASVQTNNSTITRLFKNPEDVSLTLPPALTAPTITRIASTSYARLSIAFAPYLELSEYHTNFYVHDTQQQQLWSWSTTITAGWLSSETNYDLPDFSSLSGWQNIWGLPSNVVINWGAEVIKSNDLFGANVYRYPPNASGKLLNPGLFNGLEIGTASVHGSLNP